MNVHSTPTPDPDKLAIWALQVARHTDMVATKTLYATELALLVGAIALCIAFWALFVAIGDAKNNARQLRVALARPKFDADIEVDHARTEPGSAPQGTGAPVTFKNTRITVSLQNVGDRATKDVMFSLLVPLEQTLYAQNIPNLFREVKGVRYLVRNFYSQDVMQYPFGNRLQFSQEERFKTDLGSVSILWRVYDEFGPSPAEDFGAATLVI